MVDKIKILYVADTFLPKKDGVVTFMMETYKRLKDEFNISFLAPKFTGSELAAQKLKLNVTFVPVRRFKINDYRIAHAKSKIIKAAVKSADIIFVQSAAPLGASAIKDAKKLKKKAVLYIHSIDWELLAFATRFPDKYASIIRPIVRRSHKRVTYILAPNQFIAQKIATKKLRNKIKIVHEGVDSKRFSFDRTKRVIIRNELGLRGKFVIGYVGRLSKEKNIELLIRIFNLTKKRIPEATLLLVGDGPIKKKLPKQSDILLTGNVDNPEDYLQAMDIFILLSRTETTALSLMEALSCNLPVISSAVGAIPAYVRDRENGLLLSKRSMKPEVINKLIYEIYTNPTFKNKLKNNANDTVKEFYTWDKTAAELKNFFNEISQ